MVKKSKGVGKQEIVSQDYKSIISSLESGSKLSSKEFPLTIQKLNSDYKKLAIKNLLEQKRIACINNDSMALKSKNSDIRQELETVKNEFNTSDIKLQKLQNLSQQLSSRLKTLDLKSAEDVKKEKESRLSMSNDFSASIKTISIKLDMLSKRRENIINENTRLKGILKIYLEEFDKDKAEEDARNPKLETDADEEEEEEEETEHGESLISDCDIDLSDPDSRSLDVKDTQVLSLDKSTTDADGASQQIQKADDSTVIEGITDVASSLTEEEQEELQRRAQDEEDSLRMIQLKDTEAALRAQSAQYMGVFDSFQTRLSQSNAVFAQKQAAIEQLTKEIRQLEKENKQFSAKLGQLAVSNRGYVIGNERLLKEREKVTRASDKYAELIATFQQDIGDMERMV